MSVSHIQKVYPRLQVNVNLAGLPALVLPCGFVEGGPVGLPVGLQMIGAAFDEVLKTRTFTNSTMVPQSSLFFHEKLN